MTGLDVDGRLPLADGAQVPGRVDQTPEGGDWVETGAEEGVGGGGEFKKKKKRTVISERAHSSAAQRDQTVSRRSKSHYEGERKRLGVWGGLNLHTASLEPDLN